MLGVVTMTAQVTARELQPGDIVFIGPTVAGALAPEPASAAAAQTTAGRPYYAQAPGYGPSAYGGGPSVPPNQLTVSSGVFSPTTPVAPGDLALAVSATPPTAESPIGSDGFPAAPPVGSNGFPAPAPAGRK